MVLVAKLKGLWWSHTAYKRFPGGARGKELASQCRRCKRRGFDSWVRKIPWRKAWQPTPVFLPGESHGQKSLVGFSPIVSQTVGHDWSNLACMYCLQNKIPSLYNLVLSSLSNPIPVTYHSYSVFYELLTVYQMCLCIFPPVFIHFLFSKDGLLQLFISHFSIMI